MLKGLGTGFAHGSGVYNSETNEIGMDYNYGIIDTGGSAWGSQVKVYFDFDATTLQIIAAVKAAIVIDALAKWELVITTGDIKLV